MENSYERANKMGHGDGCCILCSRQIKTIKHLLYHYPEAQQGWAGNALFYKS